MGIPPVMPNSKFEVFRGRFGSDGQFILTVDGYPRGRFPEEEMCYERAWQLLVENRLKEIG